MLMSSQPRCNYTAALLIHDAYLPSTQSAAPPHVHGAPSCSSIFFAYVVNTGTTPLTAMQVLWVNMLASVTIGVVLAFEPPEPDIMKRAPRKPGKRLLGKFVVWRTFFVCVMLVVVVIGNFWWSLQIGESVDEARTVALNTLAFSQIFYSISCRFLVRSSLHPRIFFGNKWFWVGWFITIALQMLLTYTPGIQGVFNTAFINGLDWLRILMFSIAVFLIVELEKAVGPKYILPVVFPIIKAIRRRLPTPSLPWPRRRTVPAISSEGVPVQRLGQGPEMTSTALELPGLPSAPVLQAGSKEQQGELRAPTAFIATSASTFGVPTRPQPLLHQLTRAVTSSSRALAMTSPKQPHLTRADEMDIARHAHGRGAELRARTRLRAAGLAVIAAQRMGLAAQAAAGSRSRSRASSSGSGGGDTSELLVASAHPRPFAAPNNPANAEPTVAVPALPVVPEEETITAAPNAAPATGAGTGFSATAAAASVVAPMTAGVGDDAAIAHGRGVVASEPEDTEEHVTI